MLDAKMQAYAIYTGVCRNKTSAIGSRNRLPLKRKRHAPDISTRFKKERKCNAAGNGTDTGCGFQPAIEGWRKLQGDIGNDRQTDGDKAGKNQIQSR